MRYARYDLIQKHQGGNLKSYMFIDGAYLDASVRAFCDEWLDGAFVDIDYRSLGGGQNKVFYYDALPAKRKDETEEQFTFRHNAKAKFFDELRAIDGWHVQMGISKRYTGKKAEQKEVDVLLAVDMLAHTYRKNMDHVLFLTGDQDFRPLVDAVVRDGMYLTLMYDKAHTSPDLIATADARRELDFFGFYMLLDSTFRQENPCPWRTNDSSREVPGPGSRSVEQAFQGGRVVAELWETADPKPTQLASFVEPNGLHWLKWGHAGSREFLKKVMSTYHGPIEWRPRGGA